MRYLALAILLPSIALAQAPDGKQIALHGNTTGALPCAACHGATGQGNPSIGAPQLAGLPVSTIITALKNFANGQGNNAMMQNIASSLTPQEMQAVATYFSKP